MISNQFLYSYHCLLLTHTAILQKYLDNFDLSIKIIYIVGTLAFTVGEFPKPEQLFAMIKLMKLDIRLSSLRNCCDGHLPRCLCVHDHDQHHGHHLHEHLLLPLCTTWAVFWNKRGMSIASLWMFFIKSCSSVCCPINAHRNTQNIIDW